jgi:hypothetical protein
VVGYWLLELVIMKICETGTSANVCSKINVPLYCLETRALEFGSMENQVYPPAGNACKAEMQIV